MTDFHINKVHSLMLNQKNIRNISVIAHVDHGKSTLTETLIVKAKIKPQSSDNKRFMDSRKDEAERGITIKSAAVSLHTTLDQCLVDNYLGKEAVNGNEFLINLIDSPGHVDFSSEVSAALRVTDGAVVVVDCVEGLCVQTKTVLRQAMEEKIFPTLVVNKLDRSILELGHSQADLYKKVRNVIDNFNTYLSTLSKLYPVESLRPEKNQISFCSGLQGWGFTLRTFARFYIKNFDASKYDKEMKLTEHFWRSDISCSSTDPWDPKMKFVKKSEVDPETSPFVVYVLNPIYKVRDMCLNGHIESLKEYLSKYYQVNFTGVTFPKEVKEVFKMVMRLWLPAADCLLEQVCIQLPSPLKSQQDRYDYLYEGPKDSSIAKAIKECDASPDAPVMMYVSKMVPGEGNRFFAFGRVFSGTVVPGMQVWIQEPEYDPTVATDENRSLRKDGKIQGTVVLMGGKSNAVPNCPAGNIVGIVGVDHLLKKTGTITSAKDSYNIRSMKFSVSPVVRVAVNPKRPEDLAKFQAGLRKLAQSDPLCVVDSDEKTGQCTICCAGTLHLEVCLKDLEETYAAVPIDSKEPMVTYFEGVSDTVTTPKMTKSANKHNRLYMTVEPIDEELTKSLVKVYSDNQKVMAANFREKLNINEDWVKKIWCMAPELAPENMLIDGTKGISVIGEIKDHVSSGFKIAVGDGPLIGETLKGVRFELKDAVLHADTIHRGSNQLQQPVIQLCKGLVLAASPILYEPIFKIELMTPDDLIGTATKFLHDRRGSAEEFKPMIGDSITNIIGTIPVKESFTFDNDLKSITQGRISASLSFSHYEVLPGSMSNEESILYKTVAEVRKIKNMKNSLNAEDYFDRL